MIKILDHGYVEEVLYWGSDETIISSARMSTDGAFRGWGPIHETPETCRLHPEYCQCKVLKEGDEKLLRYLWVHKHHSPFEMAGLMVEMQLPIFVARELIRHRTMSFNELSARYTELPDLYYIPSVERLMAGKQSQKGKQGSVEGFTLEEALQYRNEMEITTGVIRKLYTGYLTDGMARELARIITPVNQYTKWRMQGTLRNWLQLLDLRLGEGVQWETQEYAKAVAVMIERRFPRTYALFQDGRP